MHPMCTLANVFLILAIALITTMTMSTASLNVYNN